MELKILNEHAGQRLDKFLAASNPLNDLASLPAISRNQLQNFIKNGIIKVNNKPAKPHYLLKTGDIINFETALIDPKPSKNDKSVDSIHKEKISWEIIKETDEYLVINKPAVLIVEGKGNNVLTEIICELYPELKKVGDDPARPGIVHRLDKDTSGLMVIAKTQTSFDNLKKQFKERKIKKKYLALVYGKIDLDSGMINFPIARAVTGFKMAALPLTVGGQKNLAGRRAITEFNVIKKFINYTLLDLKILTGRTHQIRVHLSAFGHPIVGDDIYATAKTRLLNKKLALKRIFLVAYELTFNDLAGDRLTFKIELPEELNNFLKKLK